MPPKVKVTKEDIITAAVEIVRNGGADAINARSIASALNCSTQPIFSNFSSIDDLFFAVLEKTDAIYEEYVQREIEQGDSPAYKASGIAYIRFAKEEKELFKLLYMRDRTEENYPEKPFLSKQMKPIVEGSTGLDGDKAKLFHLEMWAYVHGIATMIATGFIELDWTLISQMLTDAYRGLRKQYGME